VSAFHWPQPWPPHVDLMQRPIGKSSEAPPKAPAPPEQVDMFDAAHDLKIDTGTRRLTGDRTSNTE
jgi:hypothetical protein